MNFSLTKDTYEYLLNFADDRTILNMLSVNRKFSDQEFFERVMKRKYPLLIEFKKENESWKHLFLRMIRYISKLQEEYGIPYIFTEGYNPEEMYGQRIGRLSNFYNKALEWAAAGGHLELVKAFFEKGANDSALALMTAAEKGHINVVQYLIETDKINRFKDEFINEALVNAAFGGNIDIVRYLIDKGATWFNNAMLESAYTGHIDIVKLLIQKGATAISEAIETAQDKGHIEIVNYLTQEKNI